MEVCRRSSWQMLILLSLLIFSTTLQGVQGEFESEGPSESECRPHIEKALKQFEIGENEYPMPEVDRDSTEDIPTLEVTTEESDLFGDNKQYQSNIDSSEIDTTEDNDEANDNNDNNDDDNSNDNDINNNFESEEKNTSAENWQNDGEQESGEQPESVKESAERSTEYELEQSGEQENPETDAIRAETSERENKDDNVSDEQNQDEISNNSREKRESDSSEVQEMYNYEEGDTEGNEKEVDVDSKETEMYKEDDNIDDARSSESEDIVEDMAQSEESEDVPLVNENVETENIDESSSEKQDELQSADDDNSEDNAEKSEEILNNVEKELEETAASAETETETTAEDAETPETDNETTEVESDTTETEIEPIETVTKTAETEAKSNADETVSDAELAQLEIPEEESVVEELIQDSEEDIVQLRPRDHVAQLLKLDTESEEFEKISDKSSEIVLKNLKKLYDNAIKPLETLYKYRDLSNRHFGDSEIFSKPLILFMGPWSGGKSTIINYLLDIEHDETNLHTGAEPSPAYFNILMHGEESEILDGTQLAADYTFSGLQKFGQGLEERLKGYKFPSKLLEKVNIVEIPGILEIRKQVSRIFPFNDACQWFIDRADIIFLIYDPSKLDVGPETEAILDQLKGREHQTRIVLNKADQVKPEELMRVQGALIWNISPLMSSAQPPMMYTTSLWSQPYEQWAPVRLLQAQERAFLRDLRSAIDKRIDNKIASARRFAVRVRNHAKMVDCYLTTYYNHKSVFGNRKQVSDEIINHPQDYHIYEGLSTLTNISRYDLPDPEVYRDFFRLNALYDFQQLSSTCTYFRGCPINRLDVAIAYDLPELVGKHKRLIESAFNEPAATKTPGS